MTPLLQAPSPPADNNSGTIGGLLLVGAGILLPQLYPRIILLVDSAVGMVQAKLQERRDKVDAMKKLLNMITEQEERHQRQLNAVTDKATAALSLATKVQTDQRTHEIERQREKGDYEATIGKLRLDISGLTGELGAEHGAVKKLQTDFAALTVTHNATLKLLETETAARLAAEKERDTAIGERDTAIGERDTEKLENLRLSSQMMELRADMQEQINSLQEQVTKLKVKTGNLPSVGPIDVNGVSMPPPDTPPIEPPKE